VELVDGFEPPTC